MGLYLARERRRSRFEYPNWHTRKPGEDATELRVDAHETLPADALVGTRRLVLGHGTGFANLGPTPALEELDLVHPPLDEPGFYERLEALPALREVHVHTHAVLDRALALRVRRLPRLAGWYHSGKHGGDNTALEVLRDASDLRALHIDHREFLEEEYALQKGPGPVVTPRAIEALATTPLATLWLGSVAIAPDALREMCGLRSLRDLRLRRVRTLYAARDWAPLAELDQLEILSLFESVADTGVLAHVTRLAGLRKLDVGKTEVDGPELAELAALTRLEALGVTNAQRSGESLAKLIAALDLRDLAANQVPYGPWADGLVARGALEHICLSSTEVPDAFLTTLGRLPRLRAVELMSAKGFTARGVSALAQCPALEELGLGFTEFGDDALASLAAAPRLRELNLSAVRGVTDAGLRALAHSRTLERLTLPGEDSVSAETFASITEIPSLEFLNVSMCPGVGPAEVAAARAARPSLEMYTSPWQREADGLPRAGHVDAWGILGGAPICAHNARVLHSIDGGLRTETLDGEVLATAPPQWQLHNDVFRACGTLIAHGGDWDLVVESIDGARRVNESFSASKRRHVTASRDGRAVFYADDKHLRARDVERNRLLFCADLPWEPERVTVSHDGTVVTVCGAGVLVLRCRDGSELFRRDEPARWARSFDARTVDVVLASRRVELWSLEDGAVLEAWSPPPREQLVVLSPAPGRCVRGGARWLRRDECEVRGAGRGDQGSLRVLFDDGELWDRETSVVFDFIGSQSDTQLLEDGRAIFVNAPAPEFGLDRYDVDALLAFARSAVPRAPA